MPNFATVFSGARQRTIDRLTGHSSASTDIMVAPTEEEAYRLTGVRSLPSLPTLQTELAALRQNNAIWPATPAQWPWVTDLSRSGQGTGASVSFAEPQTMPIQYEYSYLYNNSIGSYTGVYGFNGGEAANAMTPALEVVDEPSREMLQRVPVEVQNLDLTDPRQKLATEAEALLGYTPLRQELRTPGTLKRVLAKLEIQVLEEKGVSAYKKQMAQHYSTSGKMFDPTWRITPLKDYRQPVPEFALQKAIEIKRELPEAMFYVEQLAIDPFLIVTLTPLQDFMTFSRTLTRELDPETAAYVEAWSEPKFEATM
jgi:hypothetical protein